MRLLLLLLLLGCGTDELYMREQEEIAARAKTVVRDIESEHPSPYCYPPVCNQLPGGCFEPEECPQDEEET